MNNLPVKVMRQPEESFINCLPLTVIGNKNAWIVTKVFLNPEARLNEFIRAGLPPGHEE